VTDESIPKKGPASTPVDEGDDANDRPTVSPPFDVEAFARAATSNLPDVLTIRPPPSLTLPHAMPSTSPPKVPSSEPQRSTSALWMADSLAPSAPPPRDATRRERPSIGSESALLQAMGATPAPEITERTIDDPCGEMRERASLGDFTGAIEMAELILADDPENAEAAECSSTSRAVLENMYSARIGPLDRTPIVIVPRAQMRWLSIDHRAGFILSLVDGASTVEMIVDVSGMTRLDALRILHELVVQRIVAFKSGASD